MFCYAMCRRATGWMCWPVYPHRVTVDRSGPLAYELRRAADGSVVETPLPTRVLRYEQ